jgi:cyclohexanone monooxygenase
MSARLSVGIIGAGPGGLALGILLSRAGFHDFTIFDREDDVGGTWRINTTGRGCGPRSPKSWSTSSVAPTGTACGHT